jgi:hypothetical protein
MMKKIALIALGTLLSTTAFASADHYVRKDGNHVQHLKITQQKGEVHVLVDVDFEPGANETNAKACSSEISGEATVVSANELTLKKQARGEAHYCQLKIHLDQDKAIIEETEDCIKYFAGGICRFDSEGKALNKIQ